MLEKAGLWRRDFQSGQEGFTLAAALLFGKDEIIKQIVPHYKIDALVRRVDKNRFDDRLYVETNLIEAYELLMDFTAKHLPDKFFMEDGHRLSLRTAIFREVIANIIVHREYTNAQPYTYIIYKDKVVTENANNPHGEGFIDSNKFAPFPKNPAIAKFFIQLGRVDELGSGVLNINRLIKFYSGNDLPTFFEGPVFKILIPLLLEDEIIDQNLSSTKDTSPILNLTNEKKEELFGLAKGRKNDGANDNEADKDTKYDGANDIVYDKNIKNEGANGNSDYKGTKNGGANDFVDDKNTKNGGANDIADDKNTKNGGANDFVDDKETKNDGAILTRVIKSVSLKQSKRLLLLLSTIVKNEGKRTPEYKTITNMPNTTIERYLQKLRKAGLIDFEGEATKKSGYYLSAKMKELLNDSLID